MTLKIRLNCAWSRAKTNSDGIIIGWDDYKAGDIVEVHEPIPLNDTEYEQIEEKQELHEPIPLSDTKHEQIEEKQETPKSTYPQRGGRKGNKQ